MKPLTLPQPALTQPKQLPVATGVKAGARMAACYCYTVDSHRPF